MKKIAKFLVDSLIRKFQKINIRTNITKWNHFLFLMASLFYKNLIKNPIGSLGVYLQISSNPSVIWGITLSMRYCLIGLDF